MGPVVLVMACCHQERDAWVDERAASEKAIEVSDETYQGVWTTPEPGWTRVHLFARRDDVDALFKQGFERTSQR